MRQNLSSRLSMVAWLALLPALAHAQPQVRAVTDKITYNAGTEVMMRLAPVSGAPVPLNINFSATVRYAGGSQPLWTPPASEVWSLPGASAPASYLRLWRIPPGARTGRYQIDLLGYDRISGQIVTRVRAAGSFAVHRKRVRIEGIKLGKTFYVTGDPVNCDITVKNLTHHPIHGLRVEFSNRYWPWIAGPAQQAAASVVTVADDLSLAAGARQVIYASRAALAPRVDRPTVHQYGVVVWDHSRRNVLDIAFSQIVFVGPPGVDSPRPYPLQYTYRLLRDVNTQSYRHFYPPGVNRGAVRFETSHTMFASGHDATVRFSLRNPGTTPWKHVSIVARLLGPEGKVTERKVLAERRDLAPNNVPVGEIVTFALPASQPGLYRAEVLLRDPSGNTVARGTLELGVNPLPRSILIFCAHEDDEGGWTGLIRAAVENHIPIHFVYFTSGDAGSCDLYYQHSCSPAEAMNFGALRMAETRAVLGHLGVPKDAIYFLGLPDGGSGEIWYRHIQPADPYLSVLLGCDHTPYRDVFQPNLPYARSSVVAAVKALVMRFHPQVIVTAHPRAEGHIDHIVNNYLVVQALQELAREGALSSGNIQLDVDRVYDRKTLPPTPYHYAQRVLHVSGEVMALGQEAGWFYQSQGGNRTEGNIRDFRQLHRRLVYRQVLDWNEHTGWNEKP